MWTKMWTKKSSLYNYVFKINYLVNFYGGQTGIQTQHSPFACYKTDKYKCFLSGS